MPRKGKRRTCVKENSAHILHVSYPHGYAYTQNTYKNKQRNKYTHACTCTHVDTYKNIPADRRIDE